MMVKFFIFDCNGKVVGNPKGYRTMRGAEQQQNQQGSPAYNAIWDAYWENETRRSGQRILISEIKTLEGWA